MTHLHEQSLAPGASHSRVRSVFFRELPYLVILCLALFGVAYTSFSQAPVRDYWIALGPVIGIVCILSRWQSAGAKNARIRLVLTQVLHWAAVLAAIELLSVADVSRMMNADASALSTLTLLALGSFTAGVHIASWRIGLVGTILGLGVPAIAWLEQSALLILLCVAGLVGIAAPILIRFRSRSRKGDTAGWSDDDD